MSLHDLRRLGEARARLADRHSRLIGWGTGSVYDYFQSRFPTRLDYLVDNNAARWGTYVNGLEVCSPARLLKEDPQRTVVVVYSSSWPDIQRQLGAMGSFSAAPASMLFVDADTREVLARFSALATSSRGARRASFAHTIVVQGPVVDGVTVPVLRTLTSLNPQDAVLLSTWDDTERSALAEASAIADEVVLSPRPAVAGIQNRNSQIVSTRAGVARAIELGARRVLKTRSDVALLGEAIFERSSWLLDGGSEVARAAGLRGRLVVPSHYTRKFLLYHPSDMVMLGAAEDMQRYWSAPLDPRAGSLVAPELLDQPLAALSLNGHPAESYLGVEFCRTIGRPVAGTLADSWAFYRDFLAVVDDDWFEMLWLKNLTMPDAGMRSGVRQLVSHVFWQRLQAHDPALARDLREVDPETTTLTAGAAA